MTPDYEGIADRLNKDGIMVSPTGLKEIEAALIAARAKPVQESNTQPSNEHETLKPCPWCESAAVRVAYVRVSDDCRWHHVECANCLAYGPHRSTEAEAIAAWNIRATPSPSTDTLGDLLQPARLDHGASEAVGEPVYTTAPMTDTLERREAIARAIYEAVSYGAVPWGDFRTVEGRRSFYDAADAILALTTSPRVDEGRASDKALFALVERMWARYPKDDEPDEGWSEEVQDVMELLGWNHTLYNMSHPSKEDVEARDLIRRSAELLKPAEHEAVFYVRVGGDRTQLTTQAGKRADPQACLSAAIKALAAEAGDAANCPVHALATTPADPRVGKIEADLEAAKALLPYTSHSIGCAIYQKSWASGEPSCTCGLDAARSTLSQIEGEG